MNPSRFLRSLAAAILLSSLPAAAQDPAPARGPFTVSGTLQGVSLEEVASGLDAPVALTHAGDDRLFLTLRDGRIVILRNGTVEPQPFLDIRNRVGTAGEGGLLSVAFHPLYSTNGFFFVNYTDAAGDTVIERFRVSNDPDRADLTSRRTLLTIVQPFSNHNGGQIQFGPDGYLYIGMGDGGAAFDPGCRAQRNDTLLGKMLRLDVDQNVETPPFYGIPFDNPFRGVGANDMPDEVWAIGLRNPWRFSFDRQTGDLWIGDVGQGQREEIDFQPAASRGGENYGWKMMEGTTCQSASACPATVPPCNAAALTLPVLEYDHGTGCSVTGGTVYRGSDLPQLRGTYFFGDLCTGQIWAAARQGNGFQMRRLAMTVPNLVAFGEDRQGELYVASIAGRLFRLVGDGGGNPPPAGPDKVGLYDPARSRFHLKRANSRRGATQTFNFGRRRSGWMPLAGDWDGDGQTTIGFYDPDAALFRLKNRLKGRTSDVLFRVDPPSGDVIALAGDWDGDGDDTVGLYDRTTGRFHLKNGLAGEGFDVVLEIGSLPTGLLPLAGDWDGDGLDTVGLYDPARSIFYLENGRDDGEADVEFQFGRTGAGSLPVAGDWDGDGRDGIGVYEPRSAIFRLRNTPNAGGPDAAFLFGPRRGGWRPIAGNW